MPTTLSNYSQTQLDVVAVAMFVVGISGAVFFTRRVVKIWKGDI